MGNFLFCQNRTMSVFLRTADHGQSGDNINNAADDDDWETDPDFVNDASLENATEQVDTRAVMETKKMYSDQEYQELKKSKASKTKNRLTGFYTGAMTSGTGGLIRPKTMMPNDPK